MKQCPETFYRFAWASVSQYSRIEWEGDVVMAAILLAVMARRPVQVAGIATNPVKLKDMIAKKLMANCHLVDTVLQNWGLLRLVHGCREDQVAAYARINHLAWRVPRPVAAQLDHAMHLSKKVNMVILDSFKEFPEANEISRFKGVRGGAKLGESLTLFRLATTSGSLVYHGLEFGTFVFGGGGSSSGLCVVAPSGLLCPSSSLKLLKPCDANVSQPA